ncbi:MAG: hypothetical protein GY737_06065 [Desulfobacteraceae bacterium]|nr:hypothetical protein [Desulfobacteraceae bacterium]
MKNQLFVRIKQFIILFLFIGIVLPSLSTAETDVTDKVEIQKSRLFYNRRAMTTSLDVSLINISQDTLLSPVKVVIEDITSPNVTVANADGVTATGKPYFEYADMEPGRTSVSKRWIFNNGLRERFNYSLVVLDAAPSTVVVTGKAIAGLPVVGTINIKDSSDPVQTSFSAINFDGSYQLNINPNWTPPFMMWAEGWVNNKHLRLLSCFDLGEGETEKNVNTTPATTAIVESAMGKDASEIDPAAVEIPDPGVVAQIKEKVEQTLKDIFAVTGIPPGFNLFESPIGPVGSSTDRFFDVVNISTDDENRIVVADVTDGSQHVVIDPDQPPGSVPQEMIDSIVQTGDALTQIRSILEDFFELFQDPNDLPDQDRLEAELKPDLAQGYLHSGYGIEDRIIDLAQRGAFTGSFVGCSILRPMETRYYGTRPVEEIPDGHEEGVWVQVTENYNGKHISYLTAFVDVGGNIWKCYGNRRPFRRADPGRPRARRIQFPAGAVTYHSGLKFWHNDVGNKALDMGITNLAVFNPAFAPETIDGMDTNCVRLERRAGGLDTRFRLSNVPHYWTDESLYELSKEPGDRRIDLEALKAQETMEFILIGLNDADDPVRTWMYTIPEAPLPVSEVMANPDKYFAIIEQSAVSFLAYDPADPDNPDAFPGNGGVFSWIFPDNPELFPSWADLGWWSGINHNWNEFSIDNPAWYGPGDFSAWTSDNYQPGPNAILPRETSFTVTMRDTSIRHYQTDRRYDPWSEDVLGFENGNLIIDLTHSHKPENTSNQLQNQLRIRDREVTRLEGRVKVENGFFIDAEPGNSRAVHAATQIEFVYQPEIYYLEGGSQGYMQIVIEIRLDKDGHRRLNSWIWAANNNDWDTKWETYPGKIEPGETESKFPGTFPLGELLETPQTAVHHTIAIEHDKVNGKMTVEFDGQSSSIALSDLPGFNGDDFQFARIRTRVRKINEPGDEGSIRVLCDHVKVNGQDYDDFDGQFGLNNWYILTSE